jgi:hypothetical protein
MELIKEAKRLQQLAGINEINVNKPFSGTIKSSEDVEKYLNYLNSKGFVEEPISEENINKIVDEYNTVNVLSFNIINDGFDDDEDNEYLPLPISLGNLRYINGGLDMSFTKITSLPDNLTVEGELYLYLPQSNMTSLPDNLKVNSNLNLYDTKITSIPNNLKVNGNLNLSQTSLSEKYSKEEIRKMIEDKGGSVKGYIYTQ